MRLSVSEAADETPSGEPPAESEEADSVPEPQQSRARQSSMAALNELAGSRIRAFQAVATEAAQREKLNAFRTKPVEAGPMVNSDEMHKETLRNKVTAFEVAAKFKGTIELKKS